MCLSVPVLSMADGGTWWKAEILSYKHAIAPYGGPPFTNCLWWLAKNPPQHCAMAAILQHWSGDLVDVLNFNNTGLEI